MSKDKSEDSLNEEATFDQQAQRQHLRHIKLKHPDCIPVIFAKHKQASKSLPQPKTRMMLFKRDLKIQQAMFRLYEQIEVKPLYFFCLSVVKEKIKYMRLKQGPTIDQLYQKYGRNECLLLVYADQQLGMEGIKKMERCLMWILGILGFIWVVLFGLNYFTGWHLHGGQNTQPSPFLEQNQTSGELEDIN